MPKHAVDYESSSALAGPKELPDDAMSELLTHVSSVTRQVADSSIWRIPCASAPSDSDEIEHLTMRKCCPDCREAYFICGSCTARASFVALADGMHVTECAFCRQQQRQPCLLHTPDTRQIPAVLDATRGLT